MNRRPTRQNDFSDSGRSYPRDDSVSLQLHQRARSVLPGGTRTTVYRAPYPIYAQSGSGSRVLDVDGVERIDFLNNYTALIHGHAHPQVVQAASSAIAQGSCFGLPTVAEIELAEAICDRVPACEQVRFTNSGTEAVMMAIKAARAYTGRPKIAKCEGVYHGSYDFVETSLDSEPQNWGSLANPQSTPYALGTPEGVTTNVVVLPFNDVATSSRILGEHADEIAAVVIDPLPNRIGFIPATAEFVSMVRNFCSRVGCVLVSDEVISFRIDYSGAQTAFGFRADLTALGKVIGGGFPVGAVGGLKEIMSVFDPSAGKPAVPHGALLTVTQ